MDSTKTFWGLIFVATVGVLIWYYFFHNAETPKIVAAPSPAFRQHFHDVTKSLRIDASKLPQSLFDGFPDFEYAWDYKQQTSTMRASSDEQQTIYKLCDILISSRQEFASEKAYLNRTATHYPSLLDPNSSGKMQAHRDAVVEHCEEQWQNYRNQIVSEVANETTWLDSR
jgi:hypothetical protein